MASYTFCYGFQAPDFLFVNFRWFSQVLWLTVDSSSGTIIALCHEADNSMKGPESPSYRHTLRSLSIRIVSHLQYIAKCPFSKASMLNLRPVTEAHTPCSVAMRYEHRLQLLPLTWVPLDRHTGRGRATCHIPCSYSLVSCL